MRQRKSILIRSSLADFVKELQTELVMEGFVICGMMELRRPGAGIDDSYRVIMVDLPSVSTRILSLSSPNTLILPASITLTQTSYGAVEVLIVNTTEILAAEEHNDPVLYLALEISEKINRIITRLEKKDNATPDLITSWE